MESQKVFESNKIKEAYLLVIAYSAMRVYIGSTLSQPLFCKELNH
jgi:hypothetical protein